MKNRTDAMRRNEIEYRKKNVRMVVLKFYRNTEPDLIEYIDRLPNVTGTVRELLRKEMEKGNK